MQKGENLRQKYNRCTPLIWLITYTLLPSLPIFFYYCLSFLQFNLIYADADEKHLRKYCDRLLLSPASAPKAQADRLPAFSKQVTRLSAEYLLTCLCRRLLPAHSVCTFMLCGVEPLYLLRALF